MSFPKTNLAQRINAPSPTPSNTSANGAKRKRPADGVPVVYSQPQDTGTGEHVYTRLTYATDHLRDNPTKWLPFDDIMAFLNLPVGHVQREQLRVLMRADNAGNRISWNSANETYRYKPKLQIRNAAQLKGYLQSQKSAMGLSIKDLKDGWATVADDIKLQEDKNEVLVKRTKDGLARTVWNNDPSMMHPMEPEFAQMWHRIAIPANPDELRSALQGAGLVAATQKKEVVASAKNKKKKAPRKNGKQTNTHMAHLLKDFSGMRK
ncbi:hypothetical protein NX059_007997 [Plenodomus lindquistii]|nr:hypothetical protein NX059_007997 [Plenodomus lindquistii]